MYPARLLCQNSSRAEGIGNSRSRTGLSLTHDRIAEIDAATIRQELIDRGLLDSRGDYQIESAGTGFNTRVYVVGRSGEEPTLTVRVRRPDDRSVAEVDGLTDVSNCPGVPRLRLLTHELVVLDYLSGAPRDLDQLEERHFEVLARQLACVHMTEYPGFTPWPERELRTGTRVDLFRFRTASLANYECFADARAGRAGAELPELLTRLEALDLSAAAWSSTTFARLHGDLSRGNLLWDGDELGLIDWEFSRVGDPAEDLAYLLTEQPDAIGRLAQLLPLYIAAGGALDVAGRIPAYGLFTAVDSALWWLDYGKLRARSVSDDVDLRIESAQRWLALDA